MDEENKKVNQRYRGTLVGNARISLYDYHAFRQPKLMPLFKLPSSHGSRARLHLQSSQPPMQFLQETRKSTRFGI